MKLPQPGLLFLFGLSALLSLGSPESFWQTKDYKQWTDKDALMIMSNSPWSKQMPFPAAGRPVETVIESGPTGSAVPSAALGNSSNTTSETAMTGPANSSPLGASDTRAGRGAPTNTSPSGVPPSAGAPDSPRPITITWASATPVRLAVLRIRSGSNTVADADIENAQKQRERYVIAVSGLLPPANYDTKPKDLAQSAFLTQKGKAPVRAVDSDYRKIGDTNVYFFRFLRSSLPLSPSDGQIEFKMKLDQIEVKSHFDLKAMQYAGQLAL